MATETKEVEVSGEESYVSKLTVKTLGCKPAAVVGLPDGKNKLAIARLYGKADDVRVQENKEDPANSWTYFVGNFEGINLQDGTVLRSGKMFLPKGVSEAVETAVRTAKTKNDSVSFAFEIRAVKASNRIGYSYEAVVVKSPEAEDQLKDLRLLVTKLETGKALTSAVGGKSVLEGNTQKKAS